MKPPKLNLAAEDAEERLETVSTRDSNPLWRDFIDPLLKGERECAVGIAISVETKRKDRRRARHRIEFIDEIYGSLVAREASLRRSMGLLGEDPER